jgi:serine protease
VRVRTGCSIALAVVAASVAVALPARAAEPGQPGELIVVFKNGTVGAQAEETHDRAGGAVVTEIDAMGLDVVEVDDVAEAMATYAERPEVAYVEVNATVTAAATNDPLFEHQWHLQERAGANKGTVNAEPAWSKTKGKGVTVAIVDTGVKRGGADFESSRILTGKDIVNGDSDAADDNGHGTHIAGTIAQLAGNGTGGAGIAPQAKILPVKVLDAAGAGTYSDVIEGILWAKDRADVINLSLAGTTYSKSLCDAVAKAAKKAVVVAATGNLGVSSVAYPAACSKAIGVGAVRFDGKRAGYSNRGPEVDFVAPGGDLDVDQDGDGYGDGILQQTFSGSWAYTFYEGTSMAAGHVSGAAALVLSAWKDADVYDILRRTARDLGSSGKDANYGHGAVDAAAAVNRALKSKKASGSAPKPAVLSQGYWLATVDGNVHAFGGAPDRGAPARSATGALPAFVDIAGTKSGDGYWVLDAAGGVYNYGTAANYGSIPGLRNKGVHIGLSRVVDVAPSASGKGYWILDAAGGIFSFGDATFFGSVPGLRARGLSIGQADVIGLAATPSGKGYWILDSAGGMFSFGDARFYGSVPGLRAKGISVGPAAIRAMVPTASGRGYWILDDQGGMFSFGDARYHGSVPALRAAGAAGWDPVAAMAPTASGGGYWVAERTGGVYAFGDADPQGDLFDRGITATVVGIAPRG